MPIDMINNMFYKINYEEWYKELNKISIFTNSNIQQTYIDKWLYLLKKADIKCEEFSVPEIKKQILKEQSEAPEIFQLPIEYISCRTFIHFRVSRIIQSIDLSGFSIEKAVNIDIREFKNPPCQILWTKTSEKIDIKTQPIIMVPLTISKYYKWVTVDGNHRITDAIEKGATYVKAYCLDADYLVQSNLFCTEYDKFLYIFQNELVALGTYIHKDGYSNEEALKLSYFYSGHVQCYM